MAMRETTTSIRAYLVLSGVLASLSYISVVVSSQGSIDTVLSLAGLALSIGYLYIGIRFKTLIVHAPEKVLGMLKIGGAFLGLVLVLALLNGAGVAGVPGVAFGLLITWYLFANARRLASEARSAQASESVPPVSA